MRNTSSSCCAMALPCTGFLLAINTKTWGTCKEPQQMCSSGASHPKPCTITHKIPPCAAWSPVWLEEQAFLSDLESNCCCSFSGVWKAVSVTFMLSICEVNYKWQCCKPWERRWDSAHLLCRHWFNAEWIHMAQGCTGWIVHMHRVTQKEDVRVGIFFSFLTLWTPALLQTVASCLVRQ